MKKVWLRALLRRRIAVILLLLLQIGFFLTMVISGSKSFAFINILLQLLSILVVVYIISKKDKGGYKLAWVILVMAFPLFGGLFYLLIKGQSSTETFQKRSKEIEEKARPLYGLPGIAEAAEPAMRYLEETAGFPAYQASETEYLSPGERKFERLLEELEKAESYIFMEYFIIQEGEMWDPILDVLKRKAAEGVTVRLIYDDVGCFVLLPNDYAKQLQQYGIECAVFNPFKPLLTTVQNNRDHRKIVSVDGKVAFTGGINLADEYINAYEKHGHWKDAAVMIRGKAAWSFTLMFLQMWELITGDDEDYTAFYPQGVTEYAHDGFVQPYADSPLDRENVGEHVYLQIINNARRYVYINTPYLIIDDSMLSALCLAAKSGVDVRIVTPHKWDKRFVHMTTRSYYRDLIEAGVKIYEYTPGFMHAKTFVADDAVATIGTVNLDYRSLYLHFECGVRLYKSCAVERLKVDFLQTLKCCHRVTADECHHSNMFLCLAGQLLRLCAPLM